MKKIGASKIIFGVLFTIVAAYFWPQYQAQLPQTKEANKQAVVQEIAKVPSDVSLALTTEPNDGVGVIRDAIASATKSLDLVIYELEDPQIEQDLVDAQKRGVKVRVIMQNVSTYGKHPNQDAYDFFKDQEVPVIWAQKYFTLTHQKTLIVDGQRALIMTFNLSAKYYKSSRDFALQDTDTTDVAAIAKAFDSDWSGSRKVAENGRDLVWSPGSDDTLLALIASATKSLDIYNEEMADPRITEALADAAQRGVTVRVTMTYATNWKAPFTRLSDAGVQIHTFASSASLYIHAKMVMADGKTAFVGSENFSKQSLGKNRELGILISRPDIIESLENTFTHDWTNARPFGVAATANYKK